MKSSGADVSFAELVSGIRGFLHERPSREISLSEYKRAAVFMLFLEKGGAPCVLLTRRSDKLKSHSGQVAFPGGSYDVSDADPLETAYRETYEETGIRREEIEYLGRYDDYISIAGFNVSCYAGKILSEPDYNFCDEEIQDYLEPPFSMFLKRDFKRKEQFFFEGHSHNVYYYYYKDFEIWGMTARILTDLADDLNKYFPDC